VVTADAGASSLNRRAVVEAVVSFGALLAVAVFTGVRIFDIRPLGGDNLYILSWAKRAPWSALLRVDPVVYPEWRPVAFQSVWFQYRWWGSDGIAAYFVFNLLVWTACAWLVYRLVDRLAHSKPAALLAALLVLIDVRSVSTLTLIVERQSSLACLFGLIAIVVVVRGGARLTKSEWVGVTLLLMASALSKEYGLAFAVGVGVYALAHRRSDLAVAAVAAGAAYVGLRLGFAGGGTGRFCENMGYFFVVRHNVCYDVIDGAALTQMAYNVAATGVDSLLPGAFTNEGQIGIAPFRLAASAIWLALAALGWARGPKVLRVAALVIACNTALNFLFYTNRNQLAAVCAFGVAVGVGIAALDALLRSRPGAWITRPAAAVIAVCLLAGYLTRTRAEVASEVDDLLSKDPCVEITHGDQHDPELIRRFKIKYGMSDPACTVQR
jgi:hypothetical protein